MKDKINIEENNPLLEKMNKYQYNKQMSEQNDFQNDITSYINQKHENEKRKDYNPKIVNLYKNGILVINKEEYQLRDFFIVFDSVLNNFELKCTNPKFKKHEMYYDCAVRFIDTTAFINLIKDSKIIDNKIILDDLGILNKIINEWDGYIHSEVLETDSITKKRMIK